MGTEQVSIQNILIKFRGSAQMQCKHKRYGLGCFPHWMQLRRGMPSNDLFLGCRLTIGSGSSVVAGFEVLVSQGLIDTIFIEELILAGIQIRFADW